MFFTGKTPLVVVLLLLRLLIGVSGALLDNLFGTYMSDVYGERRAKNISVLHTFYAVGSMVGPQVAALFLTCFSGWTDAYTWIGAISGAIALACFAIMQLMKKPKPAISNLDSSGAIKKIPFKEISQKNAPALRGVGTYVERILHQHLDADLSAKARRGDLHG